MSAQTVSGPSDPSGARGQTLIACALVSALGFAVQVALVDLFVTRLNGPLAVATGAAVEAAVCTGVRKLGMLLMPGPVWVRTWFLCSGPLRGRTCLTCEVPVSVSMCLMAALAACGCAAPLRLVTAVTGPAPERTAVEDALRFLPPGAAYPIVIIDPESVPDSRAVRQLDAFTVKEVDGSLRPKIYLNRESNVLQEAVKGAGLYRQVLAAIIVHEATHLGGGSETDARRAESEFFEQLVARGMVPWEEGARYLKVLRQRPLHPHPASAPH